MTVFVETLTLRVWVLSVFPRLVWWRVRRRSGPHRCYVIDGSQSALAVARASGWLAGVTVEPLRFRLLDIRDEDGVLLYLRIPTEDALQVREDIMGEPLVRDLLSTVRGERTVRRLPTYLAKAATALEVREPGTLLRALQVVQVCVWKLRQEQLTGTPAVCCLERRPWLAAIVRYASRDGMDIIPVQPTLSVRAWIRRHLSCELIGLLRGLRSRWAYARLQLRSARSRGVGAAGPRAGQPGAPRIAVDYYGYFNLNRPERYSDLFFWQQSSMLASQILLLFHLSHDPLDGEKMAQLAQHDLGAVALDPQATTVPTAPVFLPSLRPRSPRVEISKAVRASRTPDARWLREQVRDYRVLRALWSECFAAHHVKLYVSWFKYTAAHCAIADALESVGGVTAIYQRAYEAGPFAGATVVDVDILFGFSQAFADVERRSGSTIPYHVTTGYVGDHRFPLLQEEASRVRRGLERHGAQRILAFADEYSHDDVRWNTGHVFEQEDYAFLLERVLAEPWLGLILKPKVPSTLRRRLGPVAALLARAESTGRCVVFEQGVVQGSYPPAAAALGADLMVHGRLDAATAGLESALAGVPTLLLDRLGWPTNPLYQLGVGRVVFTDWPMLWQACLEHWKRPEGIPGFGDWSPMLQEFDPFRDGRAAERMGTYLQWLLEGFRAGLGRETVMADAAERYAAVWGKEMVTQVNWNPPSQAPAAPPSDAYVSKTEEIPA